MNQRQVTFEEAIRSAIQSHYFDFNGRASRSQYWWYMLFTIIVFAIINAFAVVSQTLSGWLSLIVGILLLIPSLAVTVRRLHDINKSGWYIFLGLIPVVGEIILILWFCKESDPQTNEYGPVPNLV